MFLSPLKGLFFEGSSKYLSIGRLSFWATFVPAVHQFFLGQDIKENHLWVLMFLLTYNVSKKGIHAWREVINKKPEE